MILRNSVRLGTALAIALTCSVPISGQVMAQSDLADEAKRKVNLAGRQRMLSQRMSKAACFILTGVESQRHQEMLSAAYFLFSITHDALRFGNESLGLSEETKPFVIDALDIVNDRWLAYSPLVQTAIGMGGLSAETIATLNASGLELLRDMNAAVRETSHAYGNDLEDLPLLLTITIDLAGRQRMLSQKASKEFCLIDAGIDVEKNRANLGETVSIFNATLTALIDGFPGAVMEAPNQDILSKLQDVEMLWAQPNTIFGRIAAGEGITDEDRSIIASDVEMVLSTMNEAVGLYEFVDGSQ